MNKNFRRIAAAVSLSLITSIMIVPFAAFFASAASAEDVKDTKNTETAEVIVETVDNTVEDEEIIAQIQADKTTEKAQAFDVAKKNTEDTLADIEESDDTTATIADSGNYLLNIANPDPNYISYSVELTDYDRDVLEHLVMGEAGGEGYIGACLVAQAIRDTLVRDGYKSVEHLRNSMGYYGSLYNTPNQNVLDAVEFIFDEGGAAVQHHIVYFYAPAICTSGFHESQEFVVEYNSHRFFDRW